MIDPADVDRFEQDGFVVVPELLGREQVQKVLGAMDRIYRGEYTGDRRPPRLRKPQQSFGNDQSVRWMLNARVLDGDLWSVVTDSRLGGVAAALMRSESVSIVEDQLLAKPPGGTPVNVHQDYSYWPFSTVTQLVSCWIALVDMTVQMGTLELLRGSHRWGPAPRPSELIVGSDDQWLEGIASVRPSDAPVELVPVVVPAGGGVFFHCLTFHGSHQNASEAWRKAISLHWAAAECRANLSAVIQHDYPYFFAGLRNGGPLVNKYMPRVYPSYAETAA